MFDSRGWSSIATVTTLLLHTAIRCMHCTLPYLTLPYLTSPYLTLPHLTSNDNTVHKLYDRFTNVRVTCSSSHAIVHRYFESIIAERSVYHPTSTTLSWFGLDHPVGRAYRANFRSKAVRLIAVSEVPIPKPINAYRPHSMRCLEKARFALGLKLA